MAGLAPLGVLAYATVGAVIEGGAYMVLWALEQRRKWQAEREQREQQLREEGRKEGRKRGREELAAELLRQAREGESVRQALERIDNRHAERDE